MYVGYGLLTTAGTVYALRNSYFWVSSPPFIPLLGALCFLIGANSGSYEKNFPQKLACYTALSGFMGLMLLPMLQASTIINIADAALATGLSISSLALLAKYAPTEKWFFEAGLWSLIYV
jgi:FtsH-binding integral membrane protein